MFAMFNQLFAAITRLFSAAEKAAAAVDHLGTWAEESAGAFADEARILRVAKSNTLQKENGLTLVETVPAVPKMAVRK